MLEDDYQVTEGKFEDRQQWDHRSLLDTDGEDRMAAAWRLEASGGSGSGLGSGLGSGPGSGARSRGGLGGPVSVERMVCCPWFGVAR